MSLYTSTLLHNTGRSKIDLQKEQIIKTLLEDNYETQKSERVCLSELGKNREDEGFKTDIFDCVQFVSDCLHFILLSPCKIIIARDERGNISFEFVTSRFRQIIWACFQILAIAHAVYAAVLSCAGASSKKVRDDPAQLYTLFGMFAFLLGVTTWPVLLWKKQEAIKRIFHNSFLLSSPGNQSNRGRGQVTDNIQVITICTGINK